MKAIRHNRRGLLRAIRAACVALAFASTKHAVADPVYTTPYYVVNGSNVTASGSSYSAYFYDSSDTSYTVEVSPGANLSSFTRSQLTIGAGTVTNSGNLRTDTTYSGSNPGYGISVANGTVINRGEVATTGSSSYGPNPYGSAVNVGTGTIKNSGALTSSNSNGVTMGSGALLNEASGIITSESNSAVYIAFPSQVTNAGTIYSASGYALLVGNPCT